jgi:hypothetical protein
MALLEIPDTEALILNSLTLDVPDQQNRSIWTRRRKIVGLPGAEMWMASFSIEPLATENDERPWRAFLFSLRGRQNIFHYPLPKQRHVGGKPLVNAASASGYELPLDGMQTSTRILSAGHYMTVPLPSGHQRLVMLAADLITNASGQATAQLNIELGEIPANNATVETAEPFIPVCNADQRVSISWDNAVGGAGFDLEEAL